MNKLHDTHHWSTLAATADRIRRVMEESKELDHYAGNCSNDDPRRGPYKELARNLRHGASGMIEAFFKSVESLKKEPK